MSTLNLSFSADSYLFFCHYIFLNVCHSLFLLLSCSFFSILTFKFPSVHFSQSLFICSCGFSLHFYLWISIIYFFLLISPNKNFTSEFPPTFLLVDFPNTFLPVDFPLLNFYLWISHTFSLVDFPTTFQSVISYHIFTYGLTSGFPCKFPLINLFTCECSSCFPGKPFHWQRLQTSWSAVSWTGFSPVSLNNSTRPLL